MKKIYFFTFLFLIVASPFIVSATPAEVSIITPQRINYGQPFDIKIAVDPKGNVIAGMQTDIFFDSTSLRINEIKEGNLFTQNGATTFFNNGTIKNSSVVNIFDAIIGRRNVSNYGILIVVNSTPIGTGTYNIELSNVKIASPEGLPVPLSTSNISINIFRSYDVTGDFIIDIADVISVSQHFGERTSYPYQYYDVNQDGTVDIFDIILVANHFGEKY